MLNIFQVYENLVNIFFLVCFYYLSLIIERMHKHGRLTECATIFSKHMVNVSFRNVAA